MLLIYLIVVISDDIWSVVLKVLFKKFGWILALFIVLLFMVAVVLGIIEKPHQTSSDNIEPEIIQKEKMNELATSEETVNRDESKPILDKEKKELDSDSKSYKPKLSLDKSNQVKNKLENNSLEIETAKPDNVVVSDQEQVESQIKSTINANISSELENSRPSPPASLKEQAPVESNQVIKESNALAENIQKENAKTDEIKPSVEVNIMRVDDQGGTLVAGKTKPNSTVEVLADNKVIGSTESDAEGEFVVMGDLKPSSESQTVTVRSIKKNPELEMNANTQSEDLEQIKKETEESQVNQPEGLLSDEIFVILPILAKNKSSSNIDGMRAPIIVQSSSNDIKIVQNIEIISIEEIIIDSISYSDLGEAVLVGRANPSNTVLVYLDNVLTSSSEVGAAGGWSTELTGLEPGIYELRLDEVDASGVVKSRIMTPFKKESKDFLMNMVSGSITVQTGNSLWRIARRIFGRGIRYIEIYEKNDHLIKDPNLIYPGQVFSIPTKN